MRQEAALFLDYENIHIGMESTFGATPDVHVLITAIRNRFKDYGNIILSKAYGDWERFKGVPAELQREQIEPVYIGAKRTFGVESLIRAGVAKNAADIQLALDAQELIYSKPNIETFVLISGDYDFVPLILKLHRNSKRVCLSGIRDRTSRDLRQLVGEEFVTIDELLGLKPSIVPKVPSVDWAKFILYLDQRESSRLPFIAKKMFTRELPTSIVGVYDSPEGRERVVSEAFASGICEMYYVPNPKVPGSQTAAIKLNRSHEFVINILGNPGK